MVGISKIPSEAVAFEINMAGGAGNGAVAGEAGIEEVAATELEVGIEGWGGGEGDLGEDFVGGEIEGGEGVGESVEDVEVGLGGVKGETAGAAHCLGGAFAGISGAEVDERGDFLIGEAEAGETVGPESGEPEEIGVGVGLGDHDLGEGGVGGGVVKDGKEGVRVRVEVGLDEFGRGELGEAGLGKATAELWFEEDEIAGFRIGEDEISVGKEGEGKEVGADISAIRGDGVSRGRDDGEVVIEDFVVDLGMIDGDDFCGFRWSGEVWVGIGWDDLGRGLGAGEDGGAVAGVEERNVELAVGGRDCQRPWEDSLEGDFGDEGAGGEIKDLEEVFA